MMGINNLVFEFLTEERDEGTGLVGPIRNEDIAVTLGLSTTTVAFAIVSLQEFRLIRRVRRHRVGGSVYRVLTGGES
jgi:predicted transcriptional regulator